jgi:hypothetical protein
MNESVPEEIPPRAGRRRIPVSVAVIACLYLAVGIGGFLAHFRALLAPDGIGIEITELLAVICGVFLLRAQNWARWLAVAWLALHLVISFGVWRELAVHAVFLVVIGWCLFRADASRFFQHSTT